MSLIGHFSDCNHLQYCVMKSENIELAQFPVTARGRSGSPGASARRNWKLHHSVNDFPSGIISHSQSEVISIPFKSSTYIQHTYKQFLIGRFSKNDQRAKIKRINKNTKHRVIKMVDGYKYDLSPFLKPLRVCASLIFWGEAVPKRRSRNTE